MHNGEEIYRNMPVVVRFIIKCQINAWFLRKKKNMDILYYDPLLLLKILLDSESVLWN